MKSQHNTERAFCKESELVSCLVGALQEQGYRVRMEVSNMGQSIDVVATRGRWVTVIEAKLQDWRRALTQCRAHEQIADFICIAIGSATVSASLTEEAERAGYGIIHFCRKSQEFQWVRRPSRNRRMWLPQRRHWAQSAKRINYAN
jgi:Holliday junction resolvase